MSLLWRLLDALLGWLEPRCVAVHAQGLSSPVATCRCRHRTLQAWIGWVSLLVDSRVPKGCRSAPGESSAKASIATTTYSQAQASGETPVVPSAWGRMSFGFVIGTPSQISYLMSGLGVLLAHTDPLPLLPVRWHTMWGPFFGLLGAPPFGGHLCLVETSQNSQP